MKTIINYLKTIPYIFSLIGLIVLYGCTKKTERVAIIPKISVELPVNYLMKPKKSISRNNLKPGLEKESIIYKYKAKVRDDKIIIAKEFTNEFDSLSIEKRKEKIKSFVKGYSKVFNGSELTIQEIFDNEALECDFKFESNIKDSVSIVFAKLVVLDTNFIIFNYHVRKPASKGSTKEKDEFFKSIQITP